MATIPGYNPSGNNTVDMLSPTVLLSYPESCIRKYRFPLNGERKSDRLNLLMQCVESDLTWTMEWLQYIEEAVKILPGVAGNVFSADDYLLYIQNCPSVFE
jgi:hypothetical protein